MTTIDLSKALVGADKIAAFEPQVAEAQKALEEGTCKGNDFLGWLHLPSSITPEFISEINTCAKTLQENCEAVVVAGIGGSYLGARMVIDALSNSFGWLQKSNAPRILFAGNNIGEDYLSELIDYLKGEDPEKLWQSNIFGKSVGAMIQEGLTAKLVRMPEDVRAKFRGSLTRIVNEGATGLICLIL